MIIFEQEDSRGDKGSKYCLLKKDLKSTYLFLIIYYCIKKYIYKKLGERAYLSKPTNAIYQAGCYQAAENFGVLLLNREESNILRENPFSLV